jgi:enamine deaminase RidA (YjgF/YER057c/UK114 family)
MMEIEAANISSDDKFYLLAQTASDLDSVAFGDQMRSILCDIDGQLADAGRNKAQLILARIDLQDINDFFELNILWDKWMGTDATPRRFIRQRKDLPLQCLVRVDIVVA